MAKMFYEKDCDLGKLDGKKIGIIGFGSQGHAHAMNLKDSGCDVCVGLRTGSKNWAKAEEAGLKVMTVAETAKWADIVMILVNDEVQADVYKRDIAPNLHPGAALNFASGYNITYGFIKPAADLDVIMVAPRMIGKGVRETYENGTGFPTFVVINQDVPNMIAEITKVFGAANINIASFSNKSNGKIGYNLIDVETAVDDSIIDALTKLEKVIRVRVIHF